MLRQFIHILYCPLGSHACVVPLEMFRGLMGGPRSILEADGIGFLLFGVSKNERLTQPWILQRTFRPNMP